MPLHLSNHEAFTRGLDARCSVTEADVSITAARIAEFGEPPVFQGWHQFGGERYSLRYRLRGGRRVLCFGFVCWRGCLIQQKGRYVVVNFLPVLR